MAKNIKQKVKTLKQPANNYAIVPGDFF